ncbi:MAG TPA: HNH endonuclease signature motif containing protein [Vicinamibacteria bacterium]
MSQIRHKFVAVESGPSLAALTDDELLRRLFDLLRQSRRVESDLVAHIGEVDQRRLYVREACTSMFAYCTDILHLSEAEAYLRISVARAAREHPLLLVMLADGGLHLSGIAKLAPHLTHENRDALLARATHCSKREIVELVAEIAPREEAPTLVRPLPAESPARVELQCAQVLAPAAKVVPNAIAATSNALPSSSERSGAELRPDGVRSTSEDFDQQRLAPEATSCGHVSTASPAATVEPLGASRYRIHFTASATLHRKLERLRALSRSEVPDGDLAAVIERAVTEKLERLEARRYAKTRIRKRLSETRTAPSSRHVPAAVKRAVNEHDGDQCSYVSESGRRRSERARLEYHHRHPFGLGGDHSPGNTRLMCRPHNLYLAELDYGRKVMARFRNVAGRRNPNARGT